MESVKLATMEETTHTTTAVWISRAESKVLIISGVAVALLIALIFILVQRAAPLRAEAARVLAAEVAAESKAFCQKHVLSVDAHESCVSDLQVIRDNHDKRAHPDLSLGFM
jgi:hypothetical protein